MATRRRLELDDEKLTARRALAKRIGPLPFALAGVVATILPGCALIGNLAQFDGAVEAHDAGIDGPAADGSMPRDVASDDADVGGDGTTDDGALDDGALDDGATGIDAADAASATLDPALPPDASTVTCPTTIDGAIDANSPMQVGRHSRDSTSIPSVCGTTQANPGNGADMTGAHFYAVYRFSNPTSVSACFNFTLTYDGAVAVVDTGSDAGSDAALDAGTEAGGDASRDGGADAGSHEAGLDGGTDDAAEAGPVTVPPPLQKYMVAYSTFYPTDIVSPDYLADVGDLLQPPQTMGVTVPAGGTIDVVIEAVAIAPGGVDTFTLTCATP